MSVSTKGAQKRGFFNFGSILRGPSNQLMDHFGTGDNNFWGWFLKVTNTSNNDTYGVDSAPHGKLNQFWQS